jgi:saccharopine dehydrogenase (NAD+, L-lysine-forming)
MSLIKLGVIREGKVPPDFRVPLTPKQCKAIEVLYPNVKVQVQRSPIRTFKDSEYEEQGIELVDSMNECDIIFGVKEVQVADLIPNKTFVFFSHTIKKQPHNQKLLQAIIQNKIRLIDYELIKDKNNKRIIGFGRYAGIVGCYNAFLTFGLKTGLYQLKPAHLCQDRKEVETELKKVKLPSNFRCVLTGFGRVGHGAREILEHLPIKEVTPEEYLLNQFNEPVYAQLEVEDYYGRIDGLEFVKKEFYSNPELFKSTFDRYVPVSDVYIPCHFWSSKSPIILPNDVLKDESCRLKVIADVSCDVDGPIASTIRASKIGDSIYGYDPETKSEVNFLNENAIAVMAVDNLPCELPKDASEDFGNELLKNVLPALFGDDPDRIIERASETNFKGELAEEFKYLEDYANGLVKA